MDLASLERDLNDFERDRRQKAVGEIAGVLRGGGVLAAGLTGAVNVHLHTFFSFNAAGHSPSRIAWEARKAGLDVVGSVDFDVLDAMEEMFEAGSALEIRTVAALETRVFMADLADQEINSPGEPGISYFMGTGFASLPSESSAAGKALAALRSQARARNEAMLERLNAYLAPLRIDYDRDVLPLTPSGNATERHMLAALDARSREAFPGDERLSEFWGKAMGVPPGDVKRILGDPAKFRNAVRSKLMKRGGPGYMQPDRSTFPPIGEVIRMVLESQAIPCATWLDGTSRGEADAEGLLDLYVSLGCLALNIIPDRNWNIPNPAEKELKTMKLREIVDAARKRHLILSVGTEMNNYGQKFVDTFAAPEMAPYAADFRDGAYALYGHTILQRTLGKGLTSPWAREAFGGDRKKAGDFYLEVGRKAFPPRAALVRLSSLGPPADPAAILGSVA